MKCCNTCGLDLNIKRWSHSSYCSNKCYYIASPEVHERAKKHQREYFQRIEVKARMKKYAEEYNNRPGVKERKRKCNELYRNRPEIKARMKEYNKEYCKRDYVQEKKKQRRQIPKNKAHKNAHDKEYSKEYNNRPEVKAKRKEYYKTPERRKFAKEYRNRPEVKTKMKVYIKDYRKKYSQTEHGRLIINKNNWKRRAMLSNVIHDFTIEEWLKKRNNTGGVCPDCKRNIGINKLTLDHIYSIKLANDDYELTGEKRRYAINDVQPLCGECNSGKGMKVI